MIALLKNAARRAEIYKKINASTKNGNDDQASATAPSFILKEQPLLSTFATFWQSLSDFTSLGNIALPVLSEILYTYNHIRMLGFGGASFSPDKDIPDLSGKVVLVTGGRQILLVLNGTRSYANALQVTPVSDKNP